MLTDEQLLMRLEKLCRLSRRVDARRAQLHGEIEGRPHLHAEVDLESLEEEVEGRAAPD